MIRRPLIIIIFVGLVFGIGGALLYINQTKRNSAPEQSIIEQSNTSPTPQNLLTWEDQAGFSFQYPGGLRVDKHDEDTQNYAHVEFTDPDNAGNTIVWAKDTTATTLEAWVKSQSGFTNASIIDTTLGGRSAKKILTQEPKRMIVAALDDDVVVTIEALLTTPFWSSVEETITGNFVFTSLPGEDSAGAQSIPQESYDEEEVLE